MSHRWLMGLFVFVLSVILAGCWPVPNRISVSPDGVIALTMPNETTGLYEAFPRSGHIWLIDALTGRVQTVLTEGENLSWATFSPDGQELLYVDGPPLEPQGVLSAVPPRPWRLMLFQRRTETYTELLRGDRGFLWAPTFSPDGRKIAYYRSDGESLGLFLFDRETREEHQLKLMRDRERIFYVPYEPGPLWAPDGQGVFVLGVERMLPEDSETVRIVEGQIALVSIACGCEQRVLRGFFPLVPAPFSLIASPDGTKLYFNGYDRTFSVSAQERVNLYEVALETGEQATLYDSGGIVVAPALSPDGERLLFTVIVPEEAPKADLYLLDLTSARPARKLTDDGRSGFGFWISQERVGYLRATEPGVPKAEIWIKDLSTGEERNLSVLLGVQRPVVQLIRDNRRYQEELTMTQQALGSVERQLQALGETIAELSRKLDAVQTQSAEMNDQTHQKLSELTQQIGALMADMSAVKTQLSGIEADVKATSARPALSLWQVAFALLIAVIVIVWLIRRALHTLAQQLAFPPQ
jgi:dipeptidyl aminopeptidase/acylaminoacyl peptidase